MTISLQKDALLAQFSVLAYKDREFLSNPNNLPAGWTVKTDSIAPPFAAFAFKNDSTGEVVIAYRGTDGIKDGVADLAKAGLGGAAALDASLDLGGDGAGFPGQFADRQRDLAGC